MNDLTDDVATLLVREIEGLKRELAMFPDDESVWRTVPGVTNSAANLALHVAGNVQYYIGTVLGATGYVRDRDAELSRRSGARSQIVGEADAAMSVVRRVVPALTDAQLASEFPEPISGMKFRTHTLLVHLCTHAAFHLGQAGYVRRAVMSDSRSSGPLPLSALER
jgi:uncharacterized damage-inducible protein DinB